MKQSLLRVQNQASLHTPGMMNSQPSYPLVARVLAIHKRSIDAIIKKHEELFLKQNQMLSNNMKEVL